MCILSCCFFYLKFPQCLFHTLCCFQNTCSLKQKVIKRSFDVRTIADQAEARLQNQESLLQNILHQAGPNIQTPAEIPLIPLNPSAPVSSQPYGMTQPFPRNPTFALPYSCKNRVYSCFCSDPNNTNQTQCLITTQANPIIM